MRYECWHRWWQSECLLVHSLDLVLGTFATNSLWIRHFSHHPVTYPGHALLKPKPIHMVQRSQIPDSLDIQYQVYFWICDTCDNARQSSAIISNIITSTGINAFLPVSSRTVSFNAKDIQVQKDVFTQNIAFAYALLKKHICNNRDTFQKQYNKIHYQGKGRSLLSSRTALTCLRAGGPGARKGELRFFPALLARDRSWSQPA